MTDPGSSRSSEASPGALLDHRIRCHLLDRCTFPGCREMGSSLREIRRTGHEKCTDPDCKLLGCRAVREFRPPPPPEPSTPELPSLDHMFRVAIEVVEAREARKRKEEGLNKTKDKDKDKDKTNDTPIFKPPLPKRPRNYPSTSRSTSSNQ